MGNDTSASSVHGVHGFLKYGDIVTLPVQHIRSEKTT
jgi:hypothetical protein